MHTSFFLCPFVLALVWFKLFCKPDSNEKIVVTLLFPFLVNATQSLTIYITKGVKAHSIIYNACTLLQEG